MAVTLTIFACEGGARSRTAARALGPALVGGYLLGCAAGGSRRRRRDARS